MEMQYCIVHFAFCHLQYHNGIYNNNTSINAKCVIHKVFYYNLTFKIPYCDIASDKMQNALCNIAFLIMDFIQSNLVFKMHQVHIV